MNGLVVPGQPLGDEGIGGSGTFTRGGKLYASVLGTVHRDSSTVSVIHPRPLPKPPTVSSQVLCTVNRISRAQANVSITAVDAVALPPGQDFAGVIRSQDVRAVERDKVKVWTSFRPGDVVRAEVISFPVGPGGYLLTTAKNHLGVVFARHGESRRPMRAVGWDEMEDAESGDREPRKVAGPSPAPAPAAT